MSLVSPAVRKATDTAVSRSRLPVLIAGAGIGGLACALSLARRGFAVHVHERRAVFEPEGAGIQIGPNGTRILRSLGLLERLDMLAGKPDAIHVRNGVSGATLARLPLGAWIAERHGAPYWVLHRQDLHGALLAAVRAEPSISLLMDSEIIGVTETNDGVSVETRAATAGQPTMGAGLIVADGLRSRLRDEVFDVPPLAFAGRSAARAVIDADYVPEPLRENAVGLWLAPRAHVVHYPVRGGRQTAVVFVRKDDTASDDWSTIVPQGWIDEVASALASEARQLLAVPKQWKKWALYTLKPPPFWHAGR
ncbi:MAG: FAD-dependent monooxygenase, partial [Hyphomicrobiaceae bacterium]